MLEININKQKCSGCGDCVFACPPGILYAEEFARVKKDIILECFGCQSCVVVCPTEAIVINDRR